MTLRFIHRGAHDGDDDVALYADDQGVRIDVRGDVTELRAGDILVVEVHAVGDGEDTTLTLIRDGVRTRLATGGISMTVQGMHGPTLADQLREWVSPIGCVVRLTRV